MLIFRPTSVQLRFIFEAQPEIRLRNLLDKGRFEEALDCARVYKLPLDVSFENFYRVNHSILASL
jgi:hypothetical protein